MDYEEEFKRLLLERGCKLNEKGDSDHGFLLCQDYQEFLYEVSNGTKNRDEDGWKFWPIEKFRSLERIKKDYGQEPLPIELLPEYYTVFADFRDGKKFLCFRSLRPSINYPVIHINQNLELKPYSNNFDDFVENYRKRFGYEAKNNG